MLKTKKTTRRKWPLIVPLIAILLLVLVVGIFYVHSNKQNPQASSQSPDQSIKGPSKANADTPQKQQGDKQRVAMPDPNVDSSKSTDKVPVSPTMSASITLLVQLLR